MDSALVKVDNVLAWDGLKRPFQETYQICLTDTASDWVLLLSFSTMAPADRTQPFEAKVRGVFWPRGGERQVFEVSYPLDKYEIVHASHFFQMGSSYLSLAECFGALDGLKWELTFEDPVVGFRPWPSLWGNRSFHKTQASYPRLLNFVSGCFFVGHQKFEVKHHPIFQSHSWGQTVPWELTEIVGQSFEEDSKAYFLGVWPRVRWGTRISPLMPGMVLGVSEGDVISRFPLSAFNTRLEQGEQSVRFYHKSFGRRIEGEIWLGETASDEITLTDSYGQPYTDSCHLFSDLTIKIFEGSQSGWREVKRLTSSGKSWLRQVRRKAD